VLGARDPLADPHRWFRLPAGRSDRAQDLYFDREQGVVHEFRSLDGKLSPPTHTVLRRPDGKPFSRATLVAARYDKLDLFVDRGDKTLWTLVVDDEGAGFEPVTLPDGDLLVDVTMPEAWEPEGWSATVDWAQVLVGARGRYVWTASGFEREGTPAARPWWMRTCRSEVGDTSLAALTVRLRELDSNGQVGPTSAIAFEQRYEPSGPRQIGKVALMRVALLCGPPVLSAQHLLGNSSAPLLLGVLPSPARMPRDSAGVHLLHVLLGAIFGVLAWRHLARRGATRAECLLWSVLAVLFGGFLLAYLRMLAPRPESAAHALPQRSQPGEQAASLATI
jgi:hypothetical protein